MKWFGHRHRRESASTPGSEALLEEAEAFLAGCYAQCLERRSELVPPWVRINVLAHGEIGDLERIAARELPLTRDQEAWWDIAQQVLAEELLGIVAGDSALLRRIQLGAIVPLELTWSTARDVALTPFNVVQAMRSALRSTIG